MADNTGRFPRNQRLSKPSEFRNVFKSKIRSIDSQFLVLARNNDLEYPRLGMVVSRKKLKKAVSRNYVKRLVRESFRLNNNMLAGLDLIVMPQEKIQILQGRTLRKSLFSHWRNLSKCARSS